MPEDPAAPELTDETDSDPHGDSSPLVLLFMDSGRNRELLTEALSETYRVTTARSGEALDTDFDCCIVDYPEYNRIAGTQDWHRDSLKSAFTPYVLLVDGGTLGAGSTEVWERFDDVIELPVSKAELRTRIGNLVDRRRTATELTDRERDLREERDKLADREQQLEQQNEQLEKFAGMVSHDLRNPLNVAEGHLELARETIDNVDLDKISNALDRMHLLVDDMLELARRGDQMADVEAVDLPTVAEHSWQNVGTGSASLRVLTRRRIKADRSRLLQLLENLFRNAVEHVGEDVTVSIGELDGGFYVEDDGVGISPTDRADVFEMGHSSSNEGTGFGLSIVKEIVDAHDWAIRITEGSDGGARFEITGVESVSEEGT